MTDEELRTISRFNANIRTGFPEQYNLNFSQEARYRFFGDKFQNWKVLPVLVFLKPENHRKDSGNLARAHGFSKMKLERKFAAGFLTVWAKV